MKFNSLQKHIPQNSLHFVEGWLEKESVHIKIKSARRTKLGDYRFDKNNQIHHISVDGTLNFAAFFFVLTHEIAHLKVKNLYPTGIKSHGQEWKHVFGEMLRESINAYGEELQPHILKHALNPKAAVGADRNLHRVLFLANVCPNKMVENVKERQRFRIGKRIFERGQKRKIRYICKETRTGKLYLVSGQAIVDEIISE